jgi:tetrahydromethanopterin S-methyltransferase subunit G
MTTATDIDIQQLKDLITVSSTTTQKQITDLTLEVRVGFTKTEGDFKELKSELKALDAKFEEKTKNLDQRISGKEFTARSITIGIITGLLLAFSKFLFTGKFM